MKTTTLTTPWRVRRTERREHPLMFAARAVDRFFFRPADPTALGLMRITTGILVLYVHLVYCIGLSNYLGPDAWVVNGLDRQAGRVRRDRFPAQRQSL